MTTAVLCFVFAVWPVVAFLGGLAFSPLAGIAALATSPASLRRFRPRFYMLALLAFFGFAALSVLWSPRPFALIDFESLSVRSEVLRLGLLLIAGGALMAAAGGVDESGRKLILRITTIALIVQLLAVGVLSTFELASIRFFYGNRGADEGVQNITRNALIINAAMPFLVLQLIEGRNRFLAVAISLVFFSAVIAVMVAREIDAGLLAIGLTAILYGIVRVFPRNGFRVIGGLVALAIMSAPLIFHLLCGNANALTATTSIQYRQAIWQRVLEFIWEKPIIGSGVGALRGYREQIPEGFFAGQLYVPNHPHNMLLQVWVETGAVGAALLSLAVILAAFRLPRPEAIPTERARIAAIIGGVVASWVSFDVWNEWWWAVFSLLAVLTIVHFRPANPDARAGGA